MIDLNDRCLYKAKRTDTKEWIEGYPVKYGYPGSEKWYIVPEGVVTMFGYEVVSDTICRYTGLTDKKGKKIWEKDIVSYHGYIGIVRYGQYDVTHYGFYIEWINGDEALRIDFLYWLPKIKNIGNIFDNPELLEVTE